jgi:3-oxoacyl-[acyl-carrier protein] reductase
VSDKNRVVIITGASGGIGHAMSLRMVRDGFAVVVNYAGNSAKAEELVADIKAAGGCAIAISADIGNEGEVESLFRQTLATFGQIDVVVNSAGVMPLATIAEGDLISFDKVISINLRGSFLVMSQAAKHVVKGGRIILFSSSVLAKSFPRYGAYIASKAAVEGLMRVLANELRGREITVNAVAPGPIGTDLFLKGKSDAQVAEFRMLTPLERLGTPEDIANVVSFLAGPEGGWINGQVLRANGGFA